MKCTSSCDQKWFTSSVSPVVALFHLTLFFRKLESECIYWVKVVTISIGKSDGCNRLSQPLAKRRRLNKNLPCRTRLLVTGRHSWRELKTEVTEVDVHFGSCLGVYAGRPGHHLKQRVGSMTRFFGLFIFHNYWSKIAIKPSFSTCG